MKKLRKIMGAGLALAGALVPSVASFATMTAPNVENFYNMPLTLSRIDYSDSSMTVALRGEVTELHMVVMNRFDGKMYGEGNGDRNYESLRQEEVEWGRTIFQGDVSALPRNQEVKLMAREGFSFYDDDLGFIYYALNFADGGHYEGKIRYINCSSPLKWGQWDDEMNLISYSDQDYECRIQYAEVWAVVYDESSDPYMSKYTKAKYSGGGYLVPMTYVYDIARKDSKMEALPADIKTLEQVEEETARQAEAARQEALRQAELEKLKAEANKTPEVKEVVKTKTVYQDREVQVEVPAQMIEAGYDEGDGADYEAGDGEHDCAGGEMAVGMPELTSGIQDEKPWWLLILITALVTFLICWWLLPEVRYKKQR